MILFRNVRFTAAVAVLAVAQFPAAAQQVPTNYNSITYLKVQPEKVEEFLAFVKSDMKKYEQARLELGDIKRWSALKLTSPYDVGSDFNYAIVVTYDKFPDLDPTNGSVEAAYQKAGQNRAEFNKKQRELCTFVRRSITRSTLMVGAPYGPGDFLRIDYHQTKHDRPGELAEIEATIFAPVFQYLAGQGTGFKGWSVSRPVLPTATEADYWLSTMQIFKDSESLGASPGMGPDLFAKIHPGKNYLNTMDHVYAVDTIARNRIYHVIEMVGSAIMPVKK